MFLSFKVSKRTIFALVGGLLIAALLIASDIVSRHADESKVTAADGETSEQRVQFLQSYGWEVGKQTEEKQIVIPTVWNDVYEKYNSILLTEGFDLSDYKGVVATRYTYEILNYPEDITGVYANILVFEGKIIGGDVCTYAIDGFMHGFTMEAETTGLPFGGNALDL